MSDLGLTQLTAIPPALLEVDAQALHEVLPGPSLLHLPGRQQRPLFVSVLLHGNETTGLLAIQQLLKKYAERELPRALSIFFGNVEAARSAVRRLDGQPDYNRCWPGTDAPDTAEAQLMREVVQAMRARHVFISIDVHNNTGLNPHYACINKLEPAFFQLATLFTRTVVYFIRPHGVQSIAFADLCPAVTLECGKPGHDLGVAHALDYIDTCLHLQALPSHTVSERDIDLFHTVAQVKIPPQMSFSFQDAAVDIRLDPELETLNFREVPAGTVFAMTDNEALGLVATDEQGREVSADYFQYRHEHIELTKTMMPSMLTCDEQVIRQDCLCYLMQRLPLAQDG